jgi:hypothetical protein
VGHGEPVHATVAAPAGATATIRAPTVVSAAMSRRMGAMVRELDAHQVRRLDESSTSPQHVAQSPKL